MLLKQEALFLILGGLFVVEAVSSQVQDKIGIKWLGRRLFYRAPFHHQMQHTGPGRDEGRHPAVDRLGHPRARRARDGEAAVAADS